MTDDRLDAAIKAELPAYRAPDTLRARVREAIAREAGGRRRRLPYRRLALAATLVIAAVGAWTAWTSHAKTIEHAEVAREVAQAYEQGLANPNMHFAHVHERDVAAKMYGHIGVFVWVEDGETGVPRAATIGNHHLVYWKHGGLEWWVVGDDDAAVTRFADVLKARLG
jgi:anti-sigma factor RsiW